MVGYSPVEIHFVSKQSEDMFFLKIFITRSSGFFCYKITNILVSNDNNFDVLLGWHLALNYKLWNLLTRYLGRVDIIIEIQTKK